MKIFKIINSSKKSVKSEIKIDKVKDNKKEVQDEDFVIDIKEKIKIGKYLFDESTVARCAIVKLILLGYRIKEICDILKIKSSLAWKWSHFKKI